MALSHELGSASHDWAILGEGNASGRFTDTSFLVKASGAQLKTLTAEQLVEVRFDPLVEAVASQVELPDTASRDLLMEACVGEASKTPSVETLFHADLLSLPGIHFIGHTHVTSINSVLCSRQGWELIQRGGRIFPDEVVVCGVAPCTVPYADPGLALARAIHSEVVIYQTRYNCVPKTIYLQNHGFVALGATMREVISITEMADKAARVLLGAMACGEPVFLRDSDVARIASRPDEHHRQRVLGLTSG